MKGGQGQSNATVDKERCLASALTIGMKIGSKFAGRFTYWHFDANAGCGWNSSVDVPGSPIVFHRMADAHLRGMARYAFFCDRDEQALAELMARLGKDGYRDHSYLLPGDNQEGLEVFAEYIRRSGERPHYAIGSVIVDPNGYWYRNAQGYGPPTDALIGFSIEFPRIDIVLNLNTQAYRRQRGAGYHLLPPIDVLGALNKRHWLIRRTQCAGNEYLLAVGRNVETGDHQAVGFHQLNSEAGHTIMTIANGQRQHDIFDGAA